jgi:hypothetical protein
LYTYHPGEQDVDVVVIHDVALMFVFGVCPAGQAVGWLRPPVQTVKGGQATQRLSKGEPTNLATAANA